MHPVVLGVLVTNPMNLGMLDPPTLQILRSSLP